MNQNIHLAWSILILLVLGYVDATGWSGAEMDELAQVPRTVRSNPGSYRSHYTNYTHYSGGK